MVAPFLDNHSTLVDYRIDFGHVLYLVFISNHHQNQSFHLIPCSVLLNLRNVGGSCESGRNLWAPLHAHLRRIQSPLLSFRLFNLKQISGVVQVRLVIVIVLGGKWLVRRLPLQHNQKKCVYQGKMINLALF